MYRDYSPKGVKFYYIYKALAHPETNGYVTPFTLEERLMHVREAERTLGSDIGWICDTMENDLKHALGDAPNSEFILDAEGKVVVKRSWSKPDELRSDLEKLVGAVKKPTTVSDLNMKKQPPPQVAASGVVPRVKTPGQMQPLVIEPDTASTQPYYVKLRAEADSGVLRGGNGKLYLGFHLDPLYHVHWNNLAAPLKFEVKDAAGVTVKPASGEAPEVKVESDIDPREFLVDIEAKRNAGPLEVTVKYFACNDEQGWCKPVQQTYLVHLQADRDGGSARRSGSNRPPQGARSGPPAGRPPQGVQRMMGMIVSIDTTAGILRIRTREGGEQEVIVPENAQIMRAGGRIPLDSLGSGDRVMLGLADRKDEEGRPYLMRLMAR